MLDKIMMFLGGLASIYFGLSIIIEGGHILYGSLWEYGTLRIPAGVVLIICGVVIIIFSFKRNKKGNES